MGSPRHRPSVSDRVLDATGAVAAAVIALAAGVVWVWRRVAGPGERRRFGQRTEAREARPATSRPLAIPSLQPPTGRMLLGRMCRAGRCSPPRTGAVTRCAAAGPDGRATVARSR